MSLRMLKVLGGMVAIRAIGPMCGSWCDLGITIDMRVAIVKPLFVEEHRHY